MSEYKYHSQRQAEDFARQILPVPEAYPLKTGLPTNFRDSFYRLCELAKSVYRDMSKDPEAYGLMLLDINEKDHNLARDSYRTVHRYVDTLNALFTCGEVTDHCLLVNAAQFRKTVSKTPAVPKYGLVLSKLCDFGFVFSCFNGTAIDKNADSFTAEFPEYPDMIDTIKAYCECWAEVDHFRRNTNTRDDMIMLNPQEFHHHFYRFDYKITADFSKLPVITWVNDEADYQCFDEQLKRFNEAFYLMSLKYKGLKYDGEYHYKGKRIARITSAGYSALGKPNFKLSLKIKDMDKYGDYVNALPDGIKAPMTKDSCGYCGFQGSTKEYCKFRLSWTLDGARHTGCAFWCFNFEDFNLDSVPVYLKLLEMEYGLKKA